MSETPLVARLHDRPGALERAIGLIRRRAHGIRRISVASTRNHHPIIELVLRVDESRTPRERVRRDLLGLEDLIDVRDLGSDASATRELLLAWIHSDAVPHTGGKGHVVAVSGTSSLIEVTGAPVEIDALLARLDEFDAVLASVRSGEVAAPMPRARHSTGFNDVRDDSTPNSPTNSSRATSSPSVDEFSVDSAREPQTPNSEPGTWNQQ